MFVQPKTTCLTVAEIRKLLKENDVQPSAQRIAICRYVLCEADHPTVEDVKLWADSNFPKMSLATVYNTLNLLADVGLVRQIRFPHLRSPPKCDRSNVNIHLQRRFSKVGE